jgi:hypothetical protein
MDIRGGTLNYEGIAVLNDVENAAYRGNKRRNHNRVLCTPACLQRVADALEAEAATICPFNRIQTEYGEGIEFDYAKVTRQVINAFGLEEEAKTRPINISASIDASRVTKNIHQTASGLKMTDIRGKDPLKKLKSFLTDENSLQDLQSRNNVFILKVILMKETKDSFLQFDDMFQFFRLAGKEKEERENDETNEDKFDWSQLEDLSPLDVTLTTDMAADWKLSGAGGGC